MQEGTGVVAAWLVRLMHPYAQGVHCAMIIKGERPHACMAACECAHELNNTAWNMLHCACIAAQADWQVHDRYDMQTAL